MGRIGGAAWQVHNPAHGITGYEPAVRFMRYSRGRGVSRARAAYLPQWTPCPMCQVLRHAAHLGHVHAG